jgi:hypothetical protein
MDPKALVTSSEAFWGDLHLHRSLLSMPRHRSWSDFLLHHFLSYSSLDLRADFCMRMSLLVVGGYYDLF